MVTGAARIETLEDGRARLRGVDAARRALVSDFALADAGMLGVFGMRAAEREAEAEGDRRDGQQRGRAAVFRLIHVLVLPRATCGWLRNPEMRSAGVARACRRYLTPRGKGDP